MKRRDFLQALGIGVVAAPTLFKGIRTSELNNNLSLNPKDYIQATDSDVGVYLYNQKGEQLTYSTNIEGLYHTRERIDVSSVHSTNYGLPTYINGKSSSTIKLTEIVDYDNGKLIDFIKSMESGKAHCKLDNAITTDIEFDFYINDAMWFDDMLPTHSITIQLTVTGKISIT